VKAAAAPSIDSTNEFIQQAVSSNRRVLVHCNARISRSASIVLAYLLGIHHMKYEDAYTLLKKARSNIRPNDGFVQQLKKYAEEIAETMKIMRCRQLMFNEFSVVCRTIDKFSST
jgi:protein-tyrosine phosphatase